MRACRAERPYRRAAARSRCQVRRAVATHAYYIVGFLLTSIRPIRIRAWPCAVLQDSAAAREHQHAPSIPVYTCIRQSAMSHVLVHVASVFCCSHPCDRRQARTRHPRLSTRWKQLKLLFMRIGFACKPDPEALGRELAAILTKLLDHFGVKTCVLFGHDWGGGVAWGYAARLPQRVEAVIGDSISYRGAEASLALLQKRYASTQRHPGTSKSPHKRLLLCWVESEVHLKKKGLAIAKAAGVKLRLCDDSDAVLGHVVKFLGSLKLVA
eukprot:COSAG02_NODE_8387_length_2588_cov_44.268329_3_plen_268_part_00